MRGTVVSYVEEVLVTGEEVLYSAHFHWAEKWGALMLCIVGIGIILLVNMRTTEIVITNRRLIYKRGWIARKTEEIALHRIEEVNLRQGILGRLYGYGEVQVQGTGRGNIILPSIAAPLDFKRALQEAQAQEELRK